MRVADTVSVPPRGFEPLISALKGRRPRPLDDEGVEYAKEGTMQVGLIAHQMIDNDRRRWQKERAEAVTSAPSGSGSWIRTNDLRVMSPTSYHCSIPRRSELIYS